MIPGLALWQGRAALGWFVLFVKCWYSYDNYSLAYSHFFQKSKALADDTRKEV